MITKHISDGDRSHEGNHTRLAARVRLGRAVLAPSARPLCGGVLGEGLREGCFREREEQRWRLGGQRSGPAWADFWLQRCVI